MVFSWARLPLFSQISVTALCVFFCSLVWMQSGMSSVQFDTDLARDLKEISNIQMGRVVWLGPWLGPGLHASSVYYYLFFPGVYLSNGSISSLVYTNVSIAVVALSVFAYYASRSHGWGGVAATVCIGLLPLITKEVLHPGNGFTYLFFVLLALTFLWFRGPLWLASISAGLAVGLHPAAGFLPVILLVDWWLRGRSWRAAIGGVVGFLLPLAPLIAFEVLTKGYIVRSYLEHRSTNGITLSFSFENAHQVASLLGISQNTLSFFLVLLGITWLVKWWHANTSARPNPSAVTPELLGNSLKNVRLIVRSVVWLATTAVVLCIPLFFTHLIWRYLFGVALLVGFTLVVTALEFKISRMILPVITIVLVAHSPLFAPLPTAPRTITEVTAVADTIAAQEVLDPSLPVAVVAVLTEKAEVPQADDYRFLLRNRGYTVVDVTENASAEQLLIISEVPDFHWQTWNSWETDLFGPRKLSEQLEYGTVTVAVFSR